MEAATPGSNYPRLAPAQPQAGSLAEMRALPGGEKVNYNLSEKKISFHILAFISPLSTHTELLQGQIRRYRVLSKDVSRLFDR